MSDPWDRIREHEDGLLYDSFYCAPRGSYGHPDIDQGPRHANDGLLDRAREALSFGNNGRFERLVACVSKMFNW
jgi:hypothetical protein